MILRGRVSSIENGKYRVTIPDRENVVSQPLEKAASISNLEIGDEVVADFFSNHLNGVILAKLGVTMIVQGTIYDATNRITIPDTGLISQPLAKAVHVADLQIGNNVIAILFSNKLTGVIIAKL